MIPAAPLIDTFNRVMGDLRISLTDRCNFRCLYCLPETEAAANFYQQRFAPAGRTFSTEPIRRQWQPRTALLSYEEIARVVRIVAGLGIRKIRLTGGEPLLRQNVEEVVRLIASVPGIEDLALTTNGFNFHEQAAALKDAGLRRVSFSLDSLDGDNFKRITGQDCLDTVIANIRRAQSMGFRPVKVNAVVIRDVNDHEVGALAQFARDEGVAMRFIEFMPLDSARAWLKELVVPGAEILSLIRREHELEPLPARHAAETSRRWRLAGSDAEIGIIAPVTEPFCGQCNRLRLTADGHIRTCLFSLREPDLKALLRDGSSDEKIVAWLRAVVWNKEERHHIGEADYQQPDRSMSCIGG
ncbi:MAG TPA: GTP 3',8-cyclase MoaA [Verrucomicrobiales bacterium]|nr:GTP 3',8-cyclase MoaA [Verrucomicrobiales bacterium]